MLRFPVKSLIKLVIINDVALNDLIFLLFKRNWGTYDICFGINKVRYLPCVENPHAD